MRSTFKVIHWKQLVIFFSGASILVLILLFHSAYKSKIPLCKSCNIILVSLDTLSSNHLPCYGYDRNTAPNLCKFAENNIMFTNSHSNAPWTLPSHFSIFTSLYPQHHGMTSMGGTLSNSILTLPQILKQNGYESVYVGPLNNKNLPLDKGLGRGFDSINEYTGDNSAAWDAGYNKLIENEKLGKSTFLFLHTFWVHMPYTQEESTGRHIYTVRYLPQHMQTQTSLFDESAQSFIDFVKRNRKAIQQKTITELENAKTNFEVQKIFQSLTQTEQNNIWFLYYVNELKNVDGTGEYARALYDNSIAFLDSDLIPSLLNLIKNADISKNTILIITADHGEEFMEHGNLGHQTDDLFNSVTTTPLIMYIPGVKQRKIDDMVESVDIVPTLLDLVGIKTNTESDGIDLSGTILGKPNHIKNSYLISEGANVSSIRDQKWKLILRNSSNGRIFSLFNLNSDPGEKKNMSNENKDIVNRLNSELSKLIKNGKVKNEAAQIAD